MSKPVCANCHFFIRQYRNERGVEHAFEIGIEQRIKANTGDFSWQRESESLGCYKGMWDEGFSFGGITKAKAISKQNRRSKCYFFEFQPGTFLPSAEKLQQERISLANELFKYRLTIYGLLLAIIGLLVRIV
jgi:hypothetical protein